MLTFADEILLLMLDDKKGSLFPVSDSTMGYVLAGAVLMELAFANRIDTDPDKLVVLDDNPIGHPVHDRILAAIASSPEVRDTKAWVEQISREADAIREETLAGLVGQGILEEKETKFLWVFKGRKYPLIDGRAEREVKLRLTYVLFSEEVPDPRDVAIVALADAADILRYVFSSREVENIRPRIDQVRRLDLIGREVNNAILEIERLLRIAMAHTH